MQVALNESTIIYIVPSIIIGAVVGYAIGGRTNLIATERILYGGIVSLIGGIMTALIIASFFQPDQFSFLLAVLSFAGGSAFGMGVNWTATPKKEAKRHVIFEPEDDEEFDREIEDAFKGSQ